MSCGAEEWETMTGKRRQRGQSVQRMDPPSNHRGAMCWLGLLIMLVNDVENTEQ